ncbi:hypothetical protein HYU19_03910 [Candidatus Woesearchaeota archaeon]|nr:hypothetical protein [Candidatus Woesearchaeota archaeon]
MKNQDTPLKQSFSKSTYTVTNNGLRRRRLLHFSSNPFFLLRNIEEQEKWTREYQEMGDGAYVSSPAEQSEAGYFVF